VLDRLRADFDGLRIFFNDPVLPDNGYEGRDWRDEFQVTLHLQDEVRALRPFGNLFLTNIHRVYLSDLHQPSLEDDDLKDYFLAPFGPKPAGKTTDSRTDLGELIREIDELAVFNDEAHHVHDERMAWFKSIQDIHHRMLQKDRALSLQIDVTATPKHNNGAIFVQTVSDYPLAEAIYQNVVKHPTLPDVASIARLHEQQSAIFTERYSDYLRLGIEEWRQSHAEHASLGKKAVLFVMVDDTRNCDEVGEWLEKTAPELQGAVLVIHTKNNGDISEAASGKAREELEALRKAANAIDSWDSPHKAIVSVLMLKEGWDVRNVTTIVGLRAYNSPARILPEQTLGRGLRRMYFGSDTPEHVSVIGTPAFIEFVESIRSEGVEFERKPMGPDRGRADSLVVEVDTANTEKDLDALDIAIPRLSRRFDREYRDLAELDASKAQAAPLPLRPFTPEETREIVFKTMLDDEVHHTVELDTDGVADWRSVVAFFTRQILKELRLVGGYDLLYPQVRDFVRDRLFEGGPVDLGDPVVLRNLSEPAAGKIVFDTFKKAINDLTVRDSGSSRIEDRIRLRDMRPFRTGNREYLPATKSVFDKIVPEAVGGGFELDFARFLEKAPDVTSFAKNYLAVGFKIDYVKANGDLSNYIPDFLVKTTKGEIFVVETKGRAELDLPQKMARLKQWCADASGASKSTGGPAYRFLYVDQAGFSKHKPNDFSSLTRSFVEFQ
jgi:type III restriction enzyme